MNSELSIIFFRIIVLFILFGLQFLLYRRTIRWLRTRQAGMKWAFPAVRFLFAVFNVAAVYAIIWRPPLSSFSPLVLYGAVYPYLLWHGATFFLGLVILVSSVVKIPFQLGWWGWRKLRPRRNPLTGPTPALTRFHTSRRTFIRRGMYGLTAVSFGGTAYGLAYEKSSCDLNEEEFAIDDLPPEFDGYTIGLLSDVHSGMFMDRADMELFVNKANSLQPDLFIVAGDFVNSQVREVFPFAEAFSSLRAPDGTFGVLGNHDYYTGAPETVAREVEQCGIRLLRNESLPVVRRGSKFILGGIDDTGTVQNARSRMRAAFAGAPAGTARVLISHRPYFLPAASKENVDLMLSGHTHGGQVVLGRFGQTVVAPASLASPYVWGKYQHGKTTMYVSRGIGTVGLPIRINCPPEITRIILRRRSASDPGSSMPRT